MVSEPNPKPERINPDGVRRAFAAVSNFMTQIDVCWLEDRGGDFVVPNATVARLLSIESNDVYGCLSEVLGEVTAALGEAIDHDGSGRIRQILIGAGSPAASLHAAMMRASCVVAFPAERFNDMQADSPGADHDRWRVGDVINSDQRRSIERVRSLLESYARQHGIDLTTPPPSRTSRIIRGTGDMAITADELDQRIASILKVFWDSCLPITRDVDRGWRGLTDEDGEELGRLAEVARTSLARLSEEVLLPAMATAQRIAQGGANRAERARAATLASNLNRQHHFASHFQWHLGQVMGQAGWKRTLFWPLLQDIDRALGGDGSDGRIIGLVRPQRTPALTHRDRRIPADRTAAEVLFILAHARTSLKRAEVCDRMRAPMAEKSISPIVRILVAHGWRVETKDGPSGGVVLHPEDAAYARDIGPSQ